MTISFPQQTYNSYGGTFKPPFRNLGRMLLDKFVEKNIVFPYEEIEVVCVHSAEDKEWFEKLPIYYRGKNMVRVTIPVKNTILSVDTIFEILSWAFDIIRRKKKNTINQYHENNTIQFQ